MAQKLNLKSLEVTSFVVDLNHDKARAHQGGITGTECYPTGEFLCWTQPPWCITTNPR